MPARAAGTHPGRMTATTPDSGQDARLLTAPFVLVTLGELAYFLADGMAVLLVPLHATGPLGANTAGAGLAFGVFAVSALLLRPVAGRLCDTRGRRPLLVGGAALAALTLLLTAGVDGLGDLVALRLVAGVAEAAVFVASFAAVADLAPAGRMGEAISYNSLALYVGLAGGPPLAEYLVESAPGHGFAVAWIGAAALAALSACVFMTVGETKPPGLPLVAARQPLVHRASLPLALGFLAAVIAMGAFLALAGIRAGEVGLDNVSLPLAVYGSVVVLGRVVFARVPDRLPALPLASGALVTIAAGLAITSVWSTPPTLVAGTALIALGVTFTTPAFFAAVFASVGEGQRGAASATMSAAIDLGLGAGPILLGLVAQGSGTPWALAVAAGVALVGSWWTLGLSTRAPARADQALTD